MPQDMATAEAQTIDVPRTVGLPAGACDCHTHVFADSAAFPFSPARTYTPETADHHMLSRHLKALGLDRVVVVQPSVYGFDNAATLHAIATLGQGVARGVAAVDVARASDADIARLAAGGLRGLRLNLETDGTSVHEARGLLEAAAQRVRGHGWHLQIHARLAVVAALADSLPALGLPVVLDHFGGTHAATSPDHPDFVRLLDAVRSGAVYVKLSAGHLCGVRDDDFTALKALARALIATRADRLVWGSDWPHPDPGTPGVPSQGLRPLHKVNDGRAIAMLSECAADARTFANILVSNPARLYGFESLH